MKMIFRTSIQICNKVKGERVEAAAGWVHARDKGRRQRVCPLAVVPGCLARPLRTWVLCVHFIHVDPKATRRTSPLSRDWAQIDRVGGRNTCHCPGLLGGLNGPQNQPLSSNFHGYTPEGWNPSIEANRVENKVVSQ